MICRQIIFLSNLQRVGSLRFAPCTSFLDTEKGQSQLGLVLGEFLNLEHLFAGIWFSEMDHWLRSHMAPCTHVSCFPQFPFSVLLCKWSISIIKHFIKSWSDKKKINVNTTQTNTVRRNIWMSIAGFLLREFGNLGILTIGQSYFWKLLHICPKSFLKAHIYCPSLIRWGKLAVTFPGLSVNKRDWTGCRVGSFAFLSTPHS